MKLIFGLVALGALAAPAMPVQAQGLPPGTYLRQCRDVRMEGQFLHAWCQGSRGSGNSSINVMSCSTGIGVDPDGGLICGGPGSPQQPYPPNPAGHMPTMAMPYGVPPQTGAMPAPPTGAMPKTALGRCWQALCTSGTAISSTSTSSPPSQRVAPGPFRRA